jgi:hypothetical protein
MTMKIKTLSAVIILSAAVATPVFAQPNHHSRTHGLRDFRGVYNQSTEPLYATPRTLDRSNGFHKTGDVATWLRQTRYIASSNGVHDRSKHDRYLASRLL